MILYCVCSGDSQCLLRHATITKPVSISGQYNIQIFQKGFYCIIRGFPSASLVSFNTLFASTFCFVLQDMIHNHKFILRLLYNCDCKFTNISWMSCVVGDFNVNTHGPLPRA